MDIPENQRALSTEEMLAEEANAILGDEKVRVPERLKMPDAHRNSGGEQEKPDGEDEHQPKGACLDADEHSGGELDPEIVEARRQLYRSLNELNRAALCFSGGGIRSATFCLGVLQGIAGCDATPLEALHNALPPQRAGAKTPAESLLGRFHYLSTVSGGGYVGSWLSSWRQRDTFADIFNNLTGRPSGPDIEPPEISWLRAYSNYLTPRIGLASADTWAAVAIVVRNLVLNWLILVPILCIVLLMLKILLTGAVWIAHGDHDGGIATGVLLAGLLCLIGAQAFTTCHRPPRRLPPLQTEAAAQPGNATEKQFLLGDLIWSVLSAIAVTIFFSSEYFWRNRAADWGGFSFAKRLSDNGKVDLIIVAAAAGLAIYALGWLFGLVARLLTQRFFQDKERLRWRLQPRQFGAAAWDFGAWALSGLVYGGLVGVGAILFSMLQPYPPTDQNRLSLLLAIIFGVPWVLMAQLTADNVFGGLVSYEPLSDSDREWLGRAAGWVSAVAIAWAVLTVLVFAGSYVMHLASGLVQAAGGAAGILSGFATALLGKSAKTPAQTSAADRQDLSGKLSNIALALAGPLFAAVLVIALSIGLDELLLRSSLVQLLQPAPDDAQRSIGSIQTSLSIGLAICAAVAVLASYFVNINRFSLHALYRNRLTRAYLGASRQERHPDRFTGFDANDNVRMHELWPPKSNDGRLFHVVNIALNVVSTKRWAWQERRAESFTATARHCGSSYVGFRRSKYYGDGPKNEKAEYDPTRKFGIALGTAMAISGAAVSSNMGYHSSSSLALLLTLFNVRLGWWLGNPGPAGDQHEAYRREGPRFSAVPLILEAFGQTTDERPYVYLSDGGHFENLGLYEMVRRRCRLIVLVDAGCDPDFNFADLGNALRKIYIDLGVRISFDMLRELTNRPSGMALRRLEKHGANDKDGHTPQIPYHVVGTIEYSAADGPDCRDGKVIYIKPAYHGSEGAAIRAYAKANPTFPHETTADQWFTESQFESYRSLGLDIAKDVFGRSDVRAVLHDFLMQPARQHHP